MIEFQAWFHLVVRTDFANIHSIDRHMKRGVYTWTSIALKVLETMENDRGLSKKQYRCFTDQTLENDRGHSKFERTYCEQQILTELHIYIYICIYLYLDLCILFFVGSLRVQVYKYYTYLLL